MDIYPNFTKVRLFCQHIGAGFCAAPHKRLLFAARYQLWPYYTLESDSTMHESVSPKRRLGRARFGSTVARANTKIKLLDHTNCQCPVGLTDERMSAP